MTMKKILLLFVVILLSVNVCTAAEGGKSLSSVLDSPVEIPSPAVSSILSRPTDQSITINVIPSEDMDIAIEYRRITDSTFIQTNYASTKANEPYSVKISDLKANSDYLYRIGYKKPGSSVTQYSTEYSFHTQRSPGSSFVFDVQADSHLDDRASGSLYQQTLMNELLEKPDFLIDLGDTFMTDKLPVKNDETYLHQYRIQRSFLNLVGHSVPVFLVLGNHDGESGYAMDRTTDSIAFISSELRRSYFPNPVPDGFYSGNSDKETFTGLRENYYSWEWGDALFVVLDPYGYTMTKPGGKTDGWGWTLGKTQYEWLNQTLGKSRAKYKVIFTHQLVGGNGTQGRGGAEFASLYEWGGYNPGGSWGFDHNRPGWGEPIHQLLIQNNVTVVFHGHDHLYAKQELDGIIYQEVPQPATISSSKSPPGGEYGYVSGVLLGSPGYIRVSVSPDHLRVEYIRTQISSGKNDSQENRAVVYSYTIPSTPK